LEHWKAAILGFLWEVEIALLKAVVLEMRKGSGWAAAKVLLKLMLMVVKKVYWMVPG
jgi:hypothetical protein